MVQCYIYELLMSFYVGDVVMVSQHGIHLSICTCSVLMITQCGLTWAISYYCYNFLEKISYIWCSIIWRYPALMVQCWSLHISQHKNYSCAHL